MDICRQRSKGRTGLIGVTGWRKIAGWRLEREETRRVPFLFFFFVQG